MLSSSCTFCPVMPMEHQKYADSMYTPPLQIADTCLTDNRESRFANQGRLGTLHIPMCDLTATATPALVLEAAVIAAGSTDKLHLALRAALSAAGIVHGGNLAS
jgi:hypothetical protein